MVKNSFQILAQYANKNIELKNNPFCFLSISFSLRFIDQWWYFGLQTKGVIKKNFAVKLC